MFSLPAEFTCPERSPVTGMPWFASLCNGNSCSWGMAGELEDVASTKNRSHAYGPIEEHV